MECLNINEFAGKFANYLQNYQKRFLEHISPFILDNEAAKGAYAELYDRQFDAELNEEQITSICTADGFYPQVFMQAQIAMQADFARYLSTSLDSDFHALYTLCAISDRMSKMFSDQLLYHSSLISQSAGKSAALKNEESFEVREDFSHFIERMIQKDEKLEFLNLYNGVPVRSKAKTMHFAGDALIVELNITQLLAMSEENCAYIVQNDFLSCNLKAKILWVNTTAKTAALSKFEQQPVMHALRRRYPRVHPHRFTKIALKSEDDRCLYGQMYDISQGGMGVVSTENGNFKSGDILSSDIELKNGDETIFLSLKFRLVVQIVYQSAYRYCLELLPNQKDAELIAGFAKTREAQTIDELNALIEQYGD